MKSKAVVKVITPKLRTEAVAHGSIAASVEKILRQVGEDPKREGLERTPMRAEKALRFLTSGYETDLDEIVNDALFDVAVDEMVLVKDIEFYSMCEHHMLPFYGKAHIAYLPKKKVIGLSKLPRIVDMFARRLQVQERMTQQVAETIEQVLDARGVAVVVEARHFCMMMRGVEKQHSGTTTSAMRGVFRNDKSTRDEFLSLLRMQSRY
jgi:GTP cyclohydrolase IA